MSKDNGGPASDRELLETIEQTWRVHDKHSPQTNELAEEAICSGLRELRAILAKPAPAEGEAVEVVGWTTFEEWLDHELEGSGIGADQLDSFAKTLARRAYFCATKQNQRIVAQRDAKLAPVVEALRAISAYAPCSGVKDPGFTKMHMGILARNALAAAGVEHE